MFCRTLMHVAATLLLSILIGCQTSPPKIDVPQWYIVPSKDTADTLKGVGTGLSKKSAKQRAAEDIVERISLQVETASESSQTLSLGQVSSAYQQKNKTASARIQLTNIVEEKAVKIKHDYYVQISVKRGDILQSLHEKARKASRAIKDTLSGVATKTRLETVIELNQQKGQVSELSRLIRLLKALDYVYSDTAHQALVEKFERKRADALAKFSVRVQAKKSLQPIAQSLQAYLQKQGVLALSPHPDLDIIITEQSLKKIVYGSIMADVTLTLSLKNKKNIVFYKEDIKANATSVTSYEAAKQIAFNQLSKDVEKFDAIKNLEF